MKQLKLLILLLILSKLVSSQIIYVNPIGSPNQINKYAGSVAMDQMLALPKGSGMPSTTLFQPFVSKYRAPYIYVDTLNEKVYWYSPRTNSILLLGSSGGVGGSGLIRVIASTGLVNVNDSTLALDSIFTDARYLPDGLIQPGYVTWSGTGLTFNVTSATYSIKKKRYASPAGSITLNAADPINPRYDVIAVDVNSQIIKITGTAAVNPSIPQIDPSSQIVLTVISVPAGATTPGGINQNVIYDENLESWTGTGSGNFNSTATAFHGTKSIDVSSSASPQTIDFTKNTGIDSASKYSSLQVFINLKSTFNGSIGVTLMNGSTSVTNMLGVFVKGSIAGTWQNITVPISSFAFTGLSSFNKIRFSIYNNASGFYMDYVQFQSGIIAPSVETDPVATQKTITVNGMTQKLNDNPAFTVSSNFNFDSAFALKTTDQLREGTTNLYFTNYRARASMYLTTTGTSGASTYDPVTGVLNVPQYSGSGGGGGSLNNVHAPLVKYGDTISNRYNALHYGMDTAKRLYDVSTTSGSATIISATANFVSGDAGKTILVIGAGSSGSVLRTSIASVTNATTAVLNITASATLTSDTAIFGKDNTDALQRAINDVVIAGGGTIHIPLGTYLFSKTLQTGCNCQISIPQNSGGASINKVNIMIAGETVPGGSPSSYIPIFPAAKQTRGVILYSTISGSGSVPSFIASADPANRNRNDFDISNLGIQVFSNNGVNPISITAINGGQLQKINVKRCTISPDVELSRTTSPATSEVAGIVAGGINDNGENVLQENQVVGFKYGIIAGEHTLLLGNLLYANWNGLTIPANYHPVTGNSQIFACVHEIYSPISPVLGMTAGAAPVDLTIESEWDTTTSLIGNVWFKGVYIVNDTLGQLNGNIRVNTVANGGITTNIPTYGVNVTKLSVSSFLNPYAFTNKDNNFAPQTFINAVNVKNNSGYIGSFYRTNSGFGLVNAGDVVLENSSNAVGDIVFNNNFSIGNFKWMNSAGSMGMTLNSSNVLSVGTSGGGLAIGTTSLTSIGGAVKERIQVSPNGLPFAMTDGTAVLETYINNANANAAVQIYTATNHSIGFAVNNGSPNWIFHTSGNLLIGGTAAPASMAKGIALYNGTAPSGNIGGISLWANAGELNVRDATGNVTVLSPHNFSGIPQGRSNPMAWSYYSENNGNYINVDMYKAVETIEKQSAEIEELKKEMAELKGIIYEKKQPVKLIYTGKTK